MSKVLEIYSAADSSVPMQQIQQAELHAGKGIVGDRYYSETGTFSKKLAGLPDKELTLIEVEEIDHYNKNNNYSFAHADFRRNVITQGVRLNDLEGKEFSIGGIRFYGVRLAEPCAYLEKVLGVDVVKGMMHRTGLRAQILNDGVLKPGDEFIC